jgi:hypothetical protein
LFTGWGEDKETYRGLDVGEDMSGVPQNFISYEIVHNKNFFSSQRCRIPLHLQNTQPKLKLFYFTVNSLYSQVAAQK